MPVLSSPVISSPAIADTLYWLLEYYSTGCEVTQKPRVANNCVRVCTCTCSAVRIGNVAESVLGPLSKVDPAVSPACHKWT